MTPEDKADNLVNQYRIVLMREDTECGNEILCSRIAKECALIAVNELIEVTESIQASDYYYWQEVKKEIEKL